MNVVASLIARFLVGAFAAGAFLAVAAYLVPTIVVNEWKLVLSAAALVGLFWAVIGLRKGPGFR